MRTHSGRLSAYSVAKIMATGDSIGGIKDIFHAIADPHDKRAARSVDQPILPDDKRAYYITLRNQRTKQEAMHANPVSDLHRWPQLFKDDPILFDLDLPSTQSMFPTHLNLPSYGTQAWAVTPFRIVSADGAHTEWAAITTLAIRDDDDRIPSLGKDVVDVFVISPPLCIDPDTHAKDTDFKRQACALHMAATMDAVVRGFVHDDPDEAAMREGDRRAASTAHRRVRASERRAYRDAPKTAERHYLCGSFSSFRNEECAGNVIIPQILKRTAFILPSIQDNDGDMHYTIVQPTRSAYILRMTHIAGWEIRASVNMTASPSAILAAVARYCASDEDLLLDDAPPPSRIPDINQALQEEGADETERRVAHFSKVMVQIEASWTNESASPDGMGLLEVLDTKDEATYDGYLTSIEENHKLWRYLVAHEAISHFTQRLVLLKEKSVHQRELMRGDAFIALYEEAYTRCAAPTDTQIAQYAGTLFDVCRGAAAVLVETKLIKPESDMAKHMPNFDAQFFDAATNDLARLVPLDGDKMRLFLTRHCRNTLPETWFETAIARFVEHPLHLIAAVLRRPSSYAPLLPPCLNTAEARARLSSYITHSMHLLNLVVGKIRHQHKTYGVRNQNDAFVDDLAYYILTTVAKGGDTGAIIQNHVLEEAEVPLRMTQIKNNILTLKEIFTSYKRTKGKYSTADQTLFDNAAQEHANTVARFNQINALYAQMIADLKENLTETHDPTAQRALAQQAKKQQQSFLEQLNEIDAEVSGVMHKCGIHADTDEMAQLHRKAAFESAIGDAEAQLAKSKSKQQEIQEMIQNYVTQQKEGDKLLQDINTLLALPDATDAAAKKACKPFKKHLHNQKATQTAANDEIKQQLEKLSDEDIRLTHYIGTLEAYLDRTRADMADGAHLSEPQPIPSHSDAAPFYFNIQSLLREQSRMETEKTQMTAALDSLGDGDTNRSEIQARLTQIEDKLKILKVAHDSLAALPGT